MIDEREDVTYPDGVRAGDGRIHIIYDHQRTPLGEVLMATFAEEDVRAGEPVSDKIRLREKVASLPRFRRPKTFPYALLMLAKAPIFRGFCFYLAWRMRCSTVENAH